jgi:hypothetical protein
MKDSYRFSRPRPDWVLREGGRLEHGDKCIIPKSLAIFVPTPSLPSVTISFHRRFLIVISAYILAQSRFEEVPP